MEGNMQEKTKEKYMKAKKIYRIFFPVFIVAVMITALTACGSKPVVIEASDVDESYLYMGGTPEKYIILSHTGAGHFGTHSDGTLTLGNVFTWTFTPAQDETGPTVTITYYNDAETYSGRPENTETYTAAYEDEVFTLTSDSGEIYVVNDTLDDSSFYSIKSKVYDEDSYREYDAANGNKYNFSNDWYKDASAGAGENFTECIKSPYGLKLYVLFEDDSYNTLMAEDYSNHELEDQDDVVYRWTDAPEPTVSIDDEDVTMENLIGTWTLVGGTEQIVLTESGFGENSTWFIDDNYNLTIQGNDFSVGYNEDIDEVYLGQSGTDYEYISSDAAISDMYPK
jgi:hypothetical protein